jgi:nitroreductase
MGWTGGIGMDGETIEFLARRRSNLAKDLGAPGPSPDQTARLLTIAARVPDHGRLAPWRFILIAGERRREVGEMMAAIAAAAEPGISDGRLEAERDRFAQAPLVVCVVSRAAPHPKIPEWEQVLSAGAVCQTLLTAAGAMGFGAQWLTGWCAYDEKARAALGLGSIERIAGFIHIGTALEAPVERPRPPIGDIVSDWSPDAREARRGACSTTG